MKYRPFGRTGMQVSEIVFGCGAVGGLLIRGDEADKRKAVRIALDGGVNWFDTAAQYGDGKSEEALGRLLKEVPETPYVSTKARIDPRQPDIPGQLERSIEASLKRLGRDSVDLLHLHNAIAFAPRERAVGLDRLLGKDGAADGLERVKSRGLAHHVGLTGLGEAGALREAFASGRFESAQVYYNLLNPSAARAMPPAWRGHDFTGVIAACRAAGMAVMCIRVFAGGHLPGQGQVSRMGVLTDDTEPEEEARRAAAVFGALGDAYGTRAQTCLRFVLSNADVACAIIGIAEPGHVEEALPAAEAGPLPPAAFEMLDKLYARDFAPA